MNSSQNITHHPSVWLGKIASSLSLQLTRRYDQLLVRRANRLEEQKVDNVEIEDFFIEGSICSTNLMNVDIKMLDQNINGRW